MNPAGLGRCESKGLTEETQILRLGQCQLNIVTPAGSVSPLFLLSYSYLILFFTLGRVKHRRLHPDSSKDSFRADGTLLPLDVRNAASPL